MEIKKDKKLIITGKTICLVTGILSLIVGVYWLIRALFYDDTNLIAILSSICIALYLITYAGKRSWTNDTAQSRKDESVICRRRRKAAHHCLGSWTAVKR